MLTGYWSKATARPVPNTASPHPREPDWLHEVAGKFTAAPLGWVLHVVVGNGSPFETFHRATSPQRRFSTLWVAKDGHAEQYAPLEYKSWAQGDGNGTYWSVETEGFPTEPLTDAQIDTLAHWHIWSGTADHVATSPGERGVITHNAGGAAWGGHTCPDPAPNAGPRSKQRPAILARAQQLRTGDDVPLTPDDIGKVASAVWAATFGPETAADRLLKASHPAAPAIPTAHDIATALAPALVAAVKAIPAGTATVDDATIAKIAAATATELATRLVR